MPASPPPNFRIGHGFDLHRLTHSPPGSNPKPLLLAGIILSRDLSLIAHSDGDVLLHALTDALLGALALPDIGELFPDSDPRWKDASSDRFLADALARLRSSSYSISNVDLTIILERPRLSPFKSQLRARLADLLSLPLDRINLKGKSHEGLDSLGRNEAIACHALVLLERTS